MKVYQKLEVPTFNLEISLGGQNGILFHQNVKRTLVNRFKYWMLCKFFPFKIERWEKEGFK